MRSKWNSRLQVLRGRRPEPFRFETIYSSWSESENRLPFAISASKISPRVAVTFVSSFFFEIYVKMFSSSLAADSCSLVQLVSESSTRRIETLYKYESSYSISFAMFYMNFQIDIKYRCNRSCFSLFPMFRDVCSSTTKNQLSQN